MKVIKRVLLVFIFLVVILLVSGLVFVHYLAHRGVPAYEREVTLAGIREPVTVFRDSLAIPHIYASNEEDLYRTVGYIMAQDRLWQMDLIRRVTTGRLSEIFGEDFVETDLFLRALRIPEKSKLVLENTSPELIVLLKAYADGVNQFIEQHIHTLPFEFSILRYNPEPWKPEHSLNIIGYMAWDLAGNILSSEVTIYKLNQKFGPEKLYQLIPDVESTESIVYPDFTWDSISQEIHAEFIKHSRSLMDLGIAAFHGSNNWAISGEKSTTGNPIFANDMHLGFGIPGIWYQMHHIIEDKLNVTGIGIPGEPLIVAGHNDSIAWGMTNLAVDDIDLYLEEVNPGNRNEYRLNGKWKTMEVREERINIKGGKELLKELRFTHRGPVISEFRDMPEVISMRWGGNDYSNEFRSVYLLNNARNWGDFKNAIKTFSSISQNFAYVDVQGNIGLYAAGGIPIRNGTGYSLLPGNTDEYDWKGKVPFEDLPHSFNPSSGIVASANNKS
ncbi:MAG: penicillin acylase family protein, partial [Bacteroidales bacterium]